MIDSMRVVCGDIHGQYVSPFLVGDRGLRVKWLLVLSMIS